MYIYWFSSKSAVTDAAADDDDDDNADNVGRHSTTTRATHRQSEMHADVFYTMGIYEPFHLLFV